MPRKSRKRNGRRRSGGTSIRNVNIGGALPVKVRIPFQNYNVMSSSGFSSFYLCPSNVGLTHISDLALLFGSYRFTSLSFQLFATSGVAQAMAYTNDIAGTVAGSVALMSQYPVFTLDASGSTSDKVINIPRKVLLAISRKWYDTNTGSSAAEQYQGLVVGYTSSGTGGYMCRGVIEFTAPCAEGYNSRRAVQSNTPVPTPSSPTNPTYEEKEFEVLASTDLKKVVLMGPPMNTSHASNDNSQAQRLDLSRPLLKRSSVPP